MTFIPTSKPLDNLPTGRINRERREARETIRLSFHSRVSRFRIERRGIYSSMSGLIIDSTSLSRFSPVNLTSITTSKRPDTLPARRTNRETRERSEAGLFRVFRVFRGFEFKAILCPPLRDRGPLTPEFPAPTDAGGNERNR